jgi:hypothetical protein
MEGIMKNLEVREAITTALMYLAGNIHASALCFIAFMLYYKLHIYLGLPQPSVDALSFVLVICTFLFKKKIERELEESGSSIQDALPKIATRTLYGVLALVLVLNADTIVNTIIEFNHWFLYEFNPK